ncbi:hypothetical protein OIN60_15375 [Paenibacillus sp. P96]|uniref:DUF2325 domain-containing protein n=1 Tax=Paenibacillus zeirhizosphaerae TaxID=2987519 RepID=A0ABT9FU01_9BACL|nr:hypothetical protein [Paenibacillus sp. P96]MDP4098139.1 hypothetical protein [Paenibacillus sp. P96]
MISKKLLKTFGMLADEIEVKLSEGFSLALLKQMNSTFPLSELSLLLKEITDQKKRSFALNMNIQIKTLSSKPFPDSQLITILRTKYAKEKTKILFYQEIFNLIFDIYGEPEELTADRFLSEERRIIGKYGPAHYYWGLRMFPIKDDSIEQRFFDFGKQLTTFTDVSKEVAVTGDLTFPKDEAKEEKESSLVAKERGLRVKAEKEVESLKKQLRSLEKSKSHLQQKNELLTLERLTLQAKLEKQTANEQLKIQDYEDKIVKLKTGEQRIIQRYEAALNKMKEENSSCNITLNEAGKMLLEYLQQGIEQYVAQLKAGLEIRTEREQLRGKINDHFQLMNALELLLEEAKIPDVPDVRVAPKKNAEGHSALQIEASPKTNNQSDETIRSQTGTFYRMDHGGYIKLENGAAFNIPESMVNSLALEHEAEVECEPTRRADGSTHYFIRVLLQGDDTYAPITQYMGYIELGEHFKFYCVDISDPTRRFPLYDKDAEIQKPKDGDPCLFNVAHGGEHARLSKLFTRYEKEYLTKENLKKEQSVKGSSGTGSKEKFGQAVAEVEPFLEGCKIVIIGGLKKWFDSIVEETGAEFYHDNGETSARIHPKLRRADALFYLITANSHEATTSCIPIAKEHNIPHFKIEGSKSNLRKLLWENRDSIRKNKRQ